MLPVTRYKRFRSGLSDGMALTLRTVILPKSRRQCNRQKLKHYILPKIGDVPMREVTEIQLQEILNSSNSSKSTAQKVKIVMQAMFRRAKSCKLILNDPSENIVLPKAPEGTHRSITDLERKEILRLAEEHYAGLYVLTLLRNGNKAR